MTASPTFDASWDALKRYRCPDWFRDAKFGIWFHWGPQSVPGVNCWYAREMYLEDSDAYRFHLATYGHPSTVGFKDIVPLWRAEDFDPDYLVGLFKKAGARYIVPVAVHHDNFDCWDSAQHRWNAVKMGPGKDVVGLWKQATEKHDLRFGVSEHLERTWSWFNTNKGHDTQGPLAGVPYDGNDRRYQDFYLPPHADTSDMYPKNPPDSWKQAWLTRILDLVDTYQPDLLATDGALPFGAYGLRLVAHFYNQNMAWHEGRLEAVYTLKNFKPGEEQGEYQEGMCVEEVERGLRHQIKPDPWQMETCIGSWFYTRAYTDKYKSVTTVVHLLTDIVSKNGNLLLNMPLRPQGDLDTAATSFLAGFTAWMDVNSEAIHGTRPWHTFGEGPTAVVEGQMTEDENQGFTAQDIRFTAKGDALYAISLGVPEKELVISALGKEREYAPARIAHVEVLGARHPVPWMHGDQGLVVQMPTERPCDHAIVVKIVPHP